VLILAVFEIVRLCKQFTSAQNKQKYFFMPGFFTMQNDGL